MTFSFLVIAVLIGKLRISLLHERDLSRRDGLTGLHNSRAFYEYGTFLIAGARRRGSGLALAFVDLDNFKLVNDQLGHQEGDEVLRLAGQMLQEHFRGSDLVARLGGDEFAVLMPETDEAAVRKVLERLRLRMQEAMLLRRLPVTMSIGAMAFTQAPASLADAVARADALMYEVKSSGKNRALVVTVSATDEGPVHSAPRS
jgi:diguanylate cyclase (GGDEF)-like protein